MLSEILKHTILPEIKEHKVEIHIPAINCMDIGSTKDAFSCKAAYPLVTYISLKNKNQAL
jgi:hypothetical protein